MSGDTRSFATTEDRRRFLQSCGRFAVTVPPALTIMLSTSLSSTAIAASAGGGGGGDSRSDSRTPPATGPDSRTPPATGPDRVQTLTTPIVDVHRPRGN